MGKSSLFSWSIWSLEMKLTKYRGPKRLRLLLCATLQLRWNKTQVLKTAVWTLRPEGRPACSTQREGSANKQRQTNFPNLSSSAAPYDQTFASIHVTAEKTADEGLPSSSGIRISEAGFLTNERNCSWLTFMKPAVGSRPRTPSRELRNSAADAALPPYYALKTKPFLRLRHARKEKPLPVWDLTSGHFGWLGAMSELIKVWKSFGTKLCVEPGNASREWTQVLYCANTPPMINCT